MENTHIMLEEMAYNEEKIMELYWIYEKKFPKYSQAWKKLAEEERTHANMIKSFAALTSGGEMEANLQGIRLAGVKQSINMLKNEIEIATERELSIKEAFETAVKIEQGLLEHDIFSVFSSKDKDLKNLFNRLEADTRSHYEMVKKLAASVK